MSRKRMLRLRARKAAGILTPYGAKERQAARHSLAQQAPQMPAPFFNAPGPLVGCRCGAWVPFVGVLPVWCAACRREAVRVRMAALEDTWLQ